MDLHEIQSLITAGEAEKALNMLTEAINAAPANDELLFARGKLYWRLGKCSAATSDFAGAAALNPDSPAVRALEQARDVADFFNPDLYNP